MGAASEGAGRAQDRSRDIADAPPARHGERARRSGVLAPDEIKAESGIACYSVRRDGRQGAHTGREPVHSVVLMNDGQASWPEPPPGPGVVTKRA